MPLQLKDRGVIPYGGGFTVVDPLTNVQVSGTTFKMLVDMVRKERMANSAPNGLDLESEIEQWCCVAYPQECEEVTTKKIRRREFGLGDVITGTRVMLSHWFNGRKLVSREEAERRAQICIHCPWNMTYRKPCSGWCPELAEIVGPIVNAQGTQYDWQLHQCQVCGCVLSAAIWVPTEIQCGPLPQEQKDMFDNVPHCWKRCNSVDKPS